MSTSEQIAFVFLVATLPVALLFIWRFSRDLWFKTPFGISLMMIAVAIVLATCSSILFRLYGPTYWGRPVMIVATAVLTFLAMLTRTVVLIRAQNAEKRSRALTEHRH